MRGRSREIGLAMTTPHVTEMRLRLEPVSPDPFVHDLDQRRVRRDHRRHGGRQRVDDQEQLVEGLRDDERGYRGQQLIAPLAGEDGADQGGREEVPPKSHDALPSLAMWSLRLEQRELRDAGGKACRLPSGEFVDVPLAQRARRLLEPADALRPERA